MRHDDDEGATLTQRLVDAARARIEHAFGQLSVRRALLYDPHAGVSDHDVSRWLARGEALAAADAGAASLSRHDRLCLELVRMDTHRGSAELMRAGMAARRILDSTDPRAYSAQVKLINLLREAFKDREGGETRAVGISQADMDGFTAAQLREVEELLAERTRITERLEQIVTDSRRQRAVAGDDRLH